MKLLVVEDEKDLNRIIVKNLIAEGYSVDFCFDGESALDYLLAAEYDGVVLDVLLPRMNGFQVLKEIRGKDIQTPVLFLTACTDTEHVVTGLDAGADDYVTKPFKLLELLSRVRALIRRNTVSTFTSREIMVDTNNMTVKKNGEVIFVTKTEFQILSCLIRNSGVIITRATLLQNIWDDNGNFIDDNTLSVHMSRLREKIGAEHITTVRGVGYRWEEGK